MTSHMKELPTHKRICQDGVPHLLYRDTRTQITFRWSGSTSHPVEVSQGEHDAPVTNLIDSSIGGVSLIQWFGDDRWASWMEAYHGLCEMWLAVITADIHGREPRMVREVW